MINKGTVNLGFLVVALLGLSAAVVHFREQPAVAGEAPSKQQLPPSPVNEPLWKNYTPPEWAKDWDHIDLSKAKRCAKDPDCLFLDARAEAEWKSGHLPGAISMPVGDFEKQFEKNKKTILKAKKLVAYCHGIGCRLSEKIAKRLVEEKHLKNVAVFFGGWPQWKEAELAIEKNEGPYHAQ